MTESIAVASNCPTCDTPFQGKHCYKCGEKNVDVKDYTLKKYLEQAVDIFTHFDGKFFLSIKYLLLYPGKLTTEFLAGRRVKLMKPLQLYLIINIVYFLFLQGLDIYFTRLEYVAKTKGFLATNAIRLAKEKAEKKQIPFSSVNTQAADAHGTTQTFVARFNDKAPGYGKAFLLLQLPLLALVCYLLYFYKQKLFVPHLVYATHLFTAILVLSFFYLVLVGLPAMTFLPNYLNTYRSILWILLAVLVAAYIAFAAKRVYKENWAITVAKTLAFMFAYVFIFNYYRVFITYATIWLM